MAVKIKCPFHEEATPSCAVYPDHYYCFGCRKYGPLSDLKGVVEVPDQPPQKKDDIAAKMTYIKTLPKREYRGLVLPCDARGAYIVWQDRRYFIKRFFNPAPTKYYRPAGHRPPLFTAKWKSYRKVYVVEGELNALSVAQAVPDSVVSPGSATNFAKYLPYLSKYDKVVIVADRDNAGTLAAMELSSQLEKDKKVVLMEKDANGWLVHHGRESLKRRLEKFY